MTVPVLFPDPPLKRLSMVFSSDRATGSFVGGERVDDRSTLPISEEKGVGHACEGGRTVELDLDRDALITEVEMGLISS